MYFAQLRRLQSQGVGRLGSWTQLCPRRGDVRLLRGFREKDGERSLLLTLPLQCHRSHCIRTPCTTSLKLNSLLKARRSNELIMGLRIQASPQRAHRKCLPDRGDPMRTCQTSRANENRQPRGHRITIQTQSVVSGDTVREVVSHCCPKAMERTNDPRTPWAKTTLCVHLGSCR